MRCNACGSEAGRPIFESANTHALTSLCQIVRGTTSVWFCRDCSHLFGQSMPELDRFYETEYKISVDHEDEDQVYGIEDGKVLFRTDHQVRVLLDFVPRKPGMRILDYGCAKGAVPKKLRSLQLDLQIYLFDVSEMYRPYWNKLVPAQNTAVKETPRQWENSFDLVTSFFALEHIPELRRTLAHIHSLIAMDGYLYGIVPDTFGNVADFVVIDHVNHFTKASLHRLLAASGFGDILIDEERHRGALVFRARKGGPKRDSPELGQYHQRSRGLAAYWNEIESKLLAQELTTVGTAAIYGAGFYGTYILTNLRHPERVAYFLDQNPFLLGKKLHGKPVIDPNTLSADIRTVYVGLNPAIARAAIAAIPGFENAELVFNYLGELGK
jgi:SAM-dependent methyltransferase